MLPKILKFGFIIVFIFLAVFISSQNNVAHADTCSTQLIGGTWYYICSDGCVSGSASRWYYYYIWNGSSWVWVGWYTVSDSTCQVNVNNASFISQNVPTTMVKNQSYAVNVTMYNSGNTTWPGGSVYRLGSQNPQDNSTWGLNRAYLAYSVSPGQSYTFSFSVTAPNNAGSYNFQWRMVQDGVEWFGSYSTNLSITVTNPANNGANFLSQTVPTTMDAGTSYSVSVTMKNNGNTTWTSGGLYRLGTPDNNSTWGLNRVYLNNSVSPGSSYTFPFTVTAPSTPGSYNFQWRMVQDGTEWFGDYTPNLVITIRCKTITCYGNSGAGGSCTYGSSPNSLIGVNGTSGTAPYTLPDGTVVRGHTISVCAQNGCYANNCQVYPDDCYDATASSVYTPMPYYDSNLCGTNPGGAGGTCTTPGNQVKLNCTTSTGQPGTATSVCRQYPPGAINTSTHYCYTNSCVCNPTGIAKTTSICSTSQTWIQQGQTTCVQNTNCVAGIATPTPSPAPICSTLVCGTCAGACSNTGDNVRNCSYTGPPGCIPQPGFKCGGPNKPQCPNSPISCPQNCLVGYNCNNGNLTCVPAGSIQGNVFVDTNGDGSQNNGELNYTGAITITSSNGASVTYSGGSYTVNNLTPGTYTISYTNGPPSGYRMTYIVNGPPPSFTVSVGASSCSFGTYKNAACDANGNISNLNFGISNVKPWIQCVGGSCRIDSGWKYKVPSTAVGGAYASVPGGSSTSPGLIYSGNIDPDFTPGQASVPNWTVGGLTYPETFAPPKIGGIVKTSYNYLASRAREANITPIDISASCGGNIGNCTLSSITHGVYIANGNLRLNSYNFTGNQNFVILVTGNLTIAGKITVQNGSTAVFSASGDITIDRSVGEAAASSTVSDIEGLYSADRNFIADGISNCATGVDLRLNVAGNIIANAGLSGGSFQNNRDLCGNDVSYPSVAITQRADLILNSPDFIKQPSYTWQEAAP